MIVESNTQSLYQRSYFFGVHSLLTARFVFSTAGAARDAQSRDILSSTAAAAA